MSDNKENKDNKKLNLEALRIDPHLRDNPKIKLKWLFPGVIMLIFLILFVVGISAKNKADVVEILVAKESKKGQALTVLTARGYVEPTKKATIAAKITGQITELLVEEGMKVKKGQILARLDASEAKVKYEHAYAELEVAKARILDLKINLDHAFRTLKRKTELYKKDCISLNEYDDAKTHTESIESQFKLAQEQVKSAKTKVNLAENEIKNCIIRAPFSGIVISKNAQIGEIVSPNFDGGGFMRTGIFTIVDMDSIEIEVDVNESYIAQVKKNQPVKAILDAYPSWEIPAYIRTIIPSADRQKATVKVRIAFEKIEPGILPEMGVKVFFLNEKATKKDENMMTIPEGCLIEENNQKYVYLVTNGKIEKRAVLKGMATPNGIAIKSGLKTGDKVVLNAHLDLKEGQKVKVKNN